MAISPYVRRLRAADRLCRCGHEWVERSSDSVRGRPPRGSRAISGRPCCRRRTSPLGRGWLTESHPRAEGSWCEGAPDSTPPLSHHGEQPHGGVQSYREASRSEPPNGKEPRWACVDASPRGSARTRFVAERPRTGSGSRARHVPEPEEPGSASSSKCRECFVEAPRSGDARAQGSRQQRASTYRQ